MPATLHETASAACGTGTAVGAADCLSLAAAPTFAAMALLTGFLGGDASGVMCLSAHHASARTGMVPMYVLMSAFHVAPWLKLISRRAAVARPTSSAAPKQGD